MSKKRAISGRPTGNPANPIPYQAPLRLGHILVSTGRTTLKQLAEALNEQQLSRRKLGEILIEKGYAGKKDVAFALTVQTLIVAGGLAALLSIAAYFHHRNTQAASTTAGITVTATVASKARLTVLYQLPEIALTEADLRRGYVDLPAATRMTVRNNDRAGCLLVFAGLGPPFEEARVYGLGRQVSITSVSACIYRPYAAGAEPLVLSYRFILSGVARVGTYLWPFSISLEPG